MALVIKLKYAAILLFFLSCWLKPITDCKEMKIRECYFKNPEMQGTVKLFTPFDCEKAEKLNQLIISKAEGISGEDKKSITDIFTLDSLEYHSFINDPSHDLPGMIETKLYYVNKSMMTYTLKMSNPRDKGGPYYQYINIDLKKMGYINFDDVIEKIKKGNANTMMKAFADKNKKKIIERYKKAISAGYGDMLYATQQVFEKPDYDIRKVHLKTDTSYFSHFTRSGIVFNVEVTDRNFENSQENSTDYVSDVCIPYAAFRPYYNKKSGLYMQVNKPKAEKNKIVSIKR